MGGLSLVRGLVGGLAGAAGNTGTQQDMAVQNQQAQANKVNEQRAKLAPYALNIKNLKSGIENRFASYQAAHPEFNGTFDDWKSGAGAQDFGHFVDQTQHNVHAMREILHPDWKPGPVEWLKTHLTDRAHITNATGRQESRLKQDLATGDQERMTAVSQAGSVNPQQDAFGKWSAEYHRATGLRPTTEQAKLFAEKQGGIAPPPEKTTAESWTADGPPVKVGDKWMQPFKSRTGETKMAAMPEGYAGPASKPQTPIQQYVTLTTKKLLAAKGKGPPLTAEENAQLEASTQGLTIAARVRADEYAAAAARYGITPVYDEDTGSEVLKTRKQVADAATKGNPMRPGSLGAPTGQDKTRALLAQSAIQQIDAMEKILEADPNLTGPGSGQWTAFQRFIGTNSPESQEFLAAATFLSEHGVGVFGGRNIHSINDLMDLFGSLRTNPEALKGALEQARSTLELFANAGGRLPQPKGPGAKQLDKSRRKVGDKKTFANGKTGVWDGNGWVAQP